MSFYRECSLGHAPLQQKSWKVFFIFLKWSPNQTNRIQMQPCWTFQNVRFALSPAQQDFQQKNPLVFWVSYYYSFLMTVKLWSKLNIPVGFSFPSFHPACCSRSTLDWLSRSMVWLEFPHCGAVGETLILPISWLSLVFVKGQREWWQLRGGRLLTFLGWSTVADLPWIQLKPWTNAQCNKTIHLELSQNKKKKWKPGFSWIIYYDT